MLRYGKGTLLTTVMAGLLALSLLTAGCGSTTPTKSAAVSGQGHESPPAGYGCEPRLFGSDQIDQRRHHQAPRFRRNRGEILHGWRSCRKGPALV